MLVKNSEHEIEINDLTVDGSGVGRIDGFATFVSGALPGELVRVKIIKVAKKYAVARIEEILKASPARIEPPCPVFKKCGGCSLQHLSYMQQLEFKFRHVKNCLKNIAKIEPPINFPLPSKEQLRYRNKTAFPVGVGESGVAIGCFQVRSHEIVDTDSCVLQSEDSDKCVGAIRNFIDKHNITVYDERTGCGIIRHIVIRKSSADELLVALVCATSEIPHEKELITMLRVLCPKVCGIVVNINRKEGNAILGDKNRVIYGESFIIEKIFEMDFAISVNSFLQVNHGAMELLYTNIMKLGKFKGDEIVADLYCGAGTISLMLAKKVARVWGIEIAEVAVENARENAKRNGVENAQFLCADCAKGFRKVIRQEGKIDAVVVDPPRKGLEKQVIDDICGCGAKKVVYVSCDPATLARDIAHFANKGFVVQVVQPVDLFPMTTHIESVCVLVRD